MLRRPLGAGARALLAACTASPRIPVLSLAGDLVANFTCIGGLYYSVGWLGNLTDPESGEHVGEHPPACAPARLPACLPTCAAADSS